MITPDELNAMQARADAATPGEWEAYSASCCPDMGGVSTDKGYNVCQVQVGRVGHPMLIEDAEFCAHAREDVPRLVQEVRRLQAQLQLCVHDASQLGNESCQYCEDILDAVLAHAEGRKPIYR